jgi:DNA-binding NtrC family response regulator
MNVPPLDILIVDDERLIRWAISRTLMDLGHHVREAADAASAIALLSEDRCPDVVLLDYRLPGAHGLELLSTIRALSPSSAVVMMSADQAPETVAEAMRRGAYAVMSKPFDMRAIEPALVSACLARRGGRQAP